MDKQMYKELVAEYMRRESKLKNKIEELELKSEQQTQDYHFDMRNKQMEIVMLESRLLKSVMENAELKDMVLDNGGDYTETDGYEVGSPSDYEEDKQLNLFND